MIYLETFLPFSERSALDSLRQEVSDALSDLFEGMSYIAEAIALSTSEGSASRSLAGRVQTVALDAGDVLTVLSLPFSLVELGDKFGDFCTQSMSYLERLDAFRTMIFTDTASLIKDTCESIGLLDRFSTELSVDCLETLAKVIGIAGVILYTSTLITHGKDLVAWGQNPQRTWSAGLLLGGEILKTLIRLTVSGLMVATAMSSFALASPWILFALCITTFVISLGLFFGKKVSQI